MPNFWQKAGKFISDAYSNGKIQDEDYRAAYHQMASTESGINSFRGIMRNFKECTEPFRKSIKTLNDSLTSIYKDTPFKELTDKIIIKNELILEDIDNINKIITKLYSKTSEWEKIFEKAKESKKIRSEKKKIFEHYEKKLHEINDDKKKSKDIELVKRNEEKYRVAVNEYILSSEKSFDIIIESLKLSWDLINPVVSDYVNEQKKYFEKITTRLIDFDNINEKYKEIKEKSLNPDSLEDNYIYDAKKFIIDKTLMQKIKKDQMWIGGNNENNKNLFLRNTNSFGKIGSNEREQRFLLIQDDFYNGV